MVPAANQAACLSLCGSGYDTVLYVLENGIEIACNDDFCGLQSEIHGASLIAGRTYIFGVSGFSTNCGPCISSSGCSFCPPVIPCVHVCPPGSQIEGEPRCPTNTSTTSMGAAGTSPPETKRKAGAG